MCHALRLLLTALLLGVWPGPVAALGLTVVGFNVESGGAEPPVVAEQIRAQPGVDIWGFSEVEDASWTETFRREAEGANTGTRFKGLTGTTGGTDRLAIVYNDARLRLVRHFQLRSVIISACGTKNARAPLVAEFRFRENEQRRFWFMVNHLQRGDAAYRRCQARMLNTWVKTNTVAMVAVGDYNFDWDIPSKGAQRDPGFDRITVGGRFKWIRPEPPLARTQCGFNSILDIVFTTATARTWPASSKILAAEDTDYCTRALGKKSDHRPVMGRFQVP